MKRSRFFKGLFLLLMAPALACGPTALQVTPTPTKTPRLIRTVQPITTSPLTSPVLPLSTSALIPTPTPVPPTPTPAPDSAPPTDTPPPAAPPTDTPPPPPPPTNTPAPPPPPTQPPPPTNTPAPPPPTQPPANEGPQVIVELPDGNTHDTGDEFLLRIVVRDPDGVASFTWGVFTQNQTPLIGGEQDCNNAPECRIEEELEAPPIAGTYLVGADALDSKGAFTRGVGEVYIK